MGNGFPISPGDTQGPPQDKGLLARLATRIERNGLYRMLVALGALTVLGLGYTAAKHVWEADERAKARRYEAWTFLMAASGPLGEPGYEEGTNNCKVANWGLAEPLQQLAADEVRLESLRLPNAYLKGMAAPGIAMPKALLTCATLDNSNLRGADLSRARIVDANISCVDLTGANLRFANLAKSGFRRANLTDADLEGTDLSQTRLHAAVLTGARLKYTNFSAANLDQTDLRGTDLSLIDTLEADQLQAACLDKDTTVLPAKLQGMTWPAPCPVDSKGRIEIRDKQACD